MPVNPRNDWTDEKIKQLAEMWNSGVHAGLIAKHFGVTRHAVWGKIHRLNLPLRGNPTPAGGKYAGVKARRHAQRTSKALVTLGKLVFLAEPQVRVSKKETCKWVMSQQPTRYCDDPALHHKSYCLAHHNICILHVPKRVRSKDYSAAPWTAFG
jgi:hypothetical protein